MSTTTILYILFAVAMIAMHMRHRHGGHGGHSGHSGHGGHGGCGGAGGHDHGRSSHGDRAEPDFRGDVVAPEQTGDAGEHRHVAHGAT